jgi:hypothetical protein
VTGVEAELLRCNARLRAWRAYGLPLHGRWQLLGDPARPHPLIRVGLHCEACGAIAGGALDFSGELGFTTGEEAERGLVEQLLAKGCSHAAPMLAPMPEAVLALYTRELSS